VGGHRGKKDMRRNAIRTSAMLVTILVLPLLIVVAQETSSLLIEGPHGETRVIQVQGKRYVEVDELARITGGSLRFVGNKVILTLPGSGDNPQSAPASAAGYSQPFAAAGIETMREILEWHAALKTAIERGYPLADAWIEDFSRQVQARLKQAEAAASTDMDQKTVPLLTNEFNNMRALTDEYLKIKANRDYIAPDFLSKDPLEQKLLACWQSLASMASSHQFVDDGSCQ
jgi:hypothetical protein